MSLQQILIELRDLRDYNEEAGNENDVKKLNEIIESLEENIKTLNTIINKIDKD